MEVQTHLQSQTGYGQAAGGAQRVAASIEAHSTWPNIDFGVLAAPRHTGEHAGLVMAHVVLTTESETHAGFATN
jgi:hypothetical protein